MMLKYCFLKKSEDKIILKRNRSNIKFNVQLGLKYLIYFLHGVCKYFHQNSKSPLKNCKAFTIKILLHDTIFKINNIIIFHQFNKKNLVSNLCYSRTN